MSRDADFLGVIDAILHGRRHVLGPQASVADVIGVPDHRRRFVGAQADPRPAQPLGRMHLNTTLIGVDTADYANGGLS